MSAMSAYETSLFEGLKDNEDIAKMKSYPHHGTLSVFDHSLNVVRTSMKIANVLSLSQKQKENIIVGAMLHDFFLYDWHEGRIREDGIHCWLHPKVALENAASRFELNKKQRNIIRSHMFPATLLHPPTCVEAWVVSTADKVCAVREYFSETARAKEIKETHSATAEI